MAVSPILLVALFSFIYGNYVIPIEATHHVYRTLQSSSSDSSNHQPYRTAYHFQPHKNWINGNIYISYKQVFIIISFLLLCLLINNLIIYLLLIFTLLMFVLWHVMLKWTCRPQWLVQYILFWSIFHFGMSKF
jgi:hypothetical protein